MRTGSVGDNSGTFCTSKTQNLIRSMKLAVLQILGTLRSEAGQAESVHPSSLGGPPWVLGVGGAVLPNQMTRALMGEGLLPWGRSQHRGIWEAPGGILSLSRLLCPHRRGFRGPLGCQTASERPMGQCGPHSANPRALPSIGHS